MPDTMTFKIINTYTSKAGQTMLLSTTGGKLWWAELVADLRHPTHGVMPDGFIAATAESLTIAATNQTELTFTVDTRFPDGKHLLLTHFVPDPAGTNAGTVHFATALYDVRD